MSPSATDRYNVRVAHGGLALVQEFLNTREIHPSYGADLLADTDDANEWVRHAVTQWREDAEPPTFSKADLRWLRGLREQFVDLVDPEHASGPVTPARVTVGLAPAADGAVHLEPVGTGRTWLASALWAETLLAQQNGTWPRLKLCRAQECRSAFYDGSRNNSGAWHNVKTCGNRANLRASRERRSN
jgi:predicted RNA-binding Zn ribbon-like protein